MIFLLIQLAFLIISTAHVYKTARSNGHSALFWTIMNVVVFLIVPQLIGVGFGIVIAVAMASDMIGFDAAASFATALGFILFAVGIAGVLLILRYVSRLNEAAHFEPPPAPGFFDLD